MGILIIADYHCNMIEIPSAAVPWEEDKSSGFIRNIKWVCLCVIIGIPVVCFKLFSGDGSIPHSFLLKTESLDPCISIIFYSWVCTIWIVESFQLLFAVIACLIHTPACKNSAPVIISINCVSRSVHNAAFSPAGIFRITCFITIHSLLFACPDKPLRLCLSHIRSFGSIILISLLRESSRNSFFHCSLVLIVFKSWHQLFIKRRGLIFGGKNSCGIQWISQSEASFIENIICIHIILVKLRNVDRKFCCGSVVLAEHHIESYRHIRTVFLHFIYLVLGINRHWNCKVCYHYSIRILKTCGVIGQINRHYNEFAAPFVNRIADGISHFCDISLQGRGTVYLGKEDNIICAFCNGHHILQRFVTVRICFKNRTFRKLAFLRKLSDSIVHRNGFIIIRHKDNGFLIRLCKRQSIVIVFDKSDRLFGDVPFFIMAFLCANVVYGIFNTVFNIRAVIRSKQTVVFL